VMKITISFAVV